MNHTILVVTLSVKNECIDSVREALKNLHAKTHALDKGCIQYDIHQNKEKENVFTVIETWESDVLLSEHVQTAHFKQFQIDTDGQLEGFDIQIMTKIL